MYLLNATHNYIHLIQIVIGSLIAKKIINRLLYNKINMHIILLVRNIASISTLKIVTTTAKKMYLLAIKMTLDVTP